MFVPDDFDPPATLTFMSAAGQAACLVPLGVEHNERDHRAWMSSIDHIRASPGFAGRDWPYEMSLADNADDLLAHADDFAAGRGFTYTVLDGDDVIGCVYIYPDDEGAHDVHVRSWVRADRADLDGALRVAVLRWLHAEWPFTDIRYAGTGRC
jgi:hypothetical protein